MLQYVWSATYMKWCTSACSMHDAYKSQRVCCLIRLLAFTPTNLQHPCPLIWAYDCMGTINNCAEHVWQSATARTAGHHLRWHDSQRHSVSGLHYNSELKRAIFKGQAPNLPLVMNHFTACNWQKYSFWALNAGEMLPQNCHPVAILQAVCRVSC